MFFFVAVAWLVHCIARLGVLGWVASFRHAEPSPESHHTRAASLCIIYICVCGVHRCQYRGGRIIRIIRVYSSKNSGGPPERGQCLDGYRRRAGYCFADGSWPFVCDSRRVNPPDATNSKPHSPNITQTESGNEDKIGYPNINDFVYV